MADVSVHLWDNWFVSIWLKLILLIRCLIKTPSWRNCLWLREIIFKRPKNNKMICKNLNLLVVVMVEGWLWLIYRNMIKLVSLRGTDSCLNWINLWSCLSSLWLSLQASILPLMLYMRWNNLKVSKEKNVLKKNQQLMSQVKKTKIICLIWTIQTV